MDSQPARDESIVEGGVDEVDKSSESESSSDSDDDSNAYEFITHNTREIPVKKRNVRLSSGGRKKTMVLKRASPGAKGVSRHLRDEDFDLTTKPVPDSSVMQPVKRLRISKTRPPMVLHNVTSFEHPPTTGASVSSTPSTSASIRDCVYSKTNLF